MRLTHSSPRSTSMRPRWGLCDMKRLRNRLDALQSHAHASMSDAQLTLAVVRDLLRDLQDGVSIKLTIAGKELPIKIVVDPRE